MSTSADADGHLLGPGLLPTPFTAAQIREASRDGLLIHTLHEPGDGTRAERWTRYRDADEEGTTIDQWRADDPAHVSTRRATWAELQRHAAFPENGTKVTEEVLDLPLGRVDCLCFHTAATAARPASTFWFSTAHPGMPVKYEIGRARTTVLSIQTA